MKRTLALSVLVVMAVACGKTGMGKNVRNDIQARMQTVQEPVAACYETALKDNRKLRGRVEISFTAAPDTGRFDKVEITRNDLGDDTLDQCIIDQVSALKLEKPQKTAVTASYPFDFAPSN